MIGYGSEAASPIPARRALRAVSGSPATKRYRVSAGGYAFAIGELPSLGCSQTNRPPGDSVFHSASADSISVRNRKSLSPSHFGMILVDRKRAVKGKRV